MTLQVHEDGDEEDLEEEEAAAAVSLAAERQREEAEVREQQAKMLDSGHKLVGVRRTAPWPQTNTAELQQRPAPAPAQHQS